MLGSKRFGIWCVVAMVVALFVGMVAGTAAVVAQDPVETLPEDYVLPIVEDTSMPEAETYEPPTIEEMPMPEDEVYVPPVIEEIPMPEDDAYEPIVVSPPSPTVVLPEPPVTPIAQAYSLLLSRLVQLNTELTQVSAEITTYEMLATLNPGDPLISHILDMLYLRMRTIQQEQHDVRFILSILIP